MPIRDTRNGFRYFVQERMVVVRCTQKLLARLEQSGDLPAVESTTRLGDWYGNILRVGARQHLLFISERSRLPVIVPLRQAKQLSKCFRRRCATGSRSSASLPRTYPRNARMSQMVYDPHTHWTSG